MEVVRVPGCEGKDGGEQRGDPSGVGTESAVAQIENCFPKSEGHGRDDGGLFGEGGEGEKDGC